jgi:chromosome segregation ATPase
VVALQELMKRQQELDKIATLDQKISMELKTLADRMEVMKTEMVMYANIDELKATHERIMAMLEQKRVVYMRRFDMVRLQVNALSGRYERLKGQVANNETAKALDSHEQKIRHYEQSIFTMRECEWRCSSWVAVIVIPDADWLQTLIPRAAKRSTSRFVRSATRWWKK